MSTLSYNCPNGHIIKKFNIRSANGIHNVSGVCTDGTILPALGGYSAIPRTIDGISDKLLLGVESTGFLNSFEYAGSRYGTPNPTSIITKSCPNGQKISGYKGETAKNINKTTMVKNLDILCGTYIPPEYNLTNNLNNNLNNNLTNFQVLDYSCNNGFLDSVDINYGTNIVNNIQGICNDGSKLQKLGVDDKNSQFKNISLKDTSNLSYYTGDNKILYNINESNNVYGNSNLTSNLTPNLTSNLTSNLLYNKFSCNNGETMKGYRGLTWYDNNGNIGIRAFSPLCEINKIEANTVNSTINLNSTTNSNNQQSNISNSNNLNNLNNQSTVNQQLVDTLTNQLDNTNTIANLNNQQSNQSTVNSNNTTNLLNPSLNNSLNDILNNSTVNSTVNSNNLNNLNNQSANIVNSTNNQSSNQQLVDTLTNQLDN